MRSITRTRTSSHNPRSNRSLARPRKGLTLPEVLVSALVLAIVLAILIPGMLTLRERSRRATCVQNLQRIGEALQQYHETYASLPPAAVWHPGGLRTAMLNEVKQIDLITHENWAQLLLPFLGQEALAREFDPRLPVMAEANDAARTSRPEEFVCPSDHWNTADNPFVFGWSETEETGIESARGNYSINGGTHNHRFAPESPGQPRFDGLELVLTETPRQFQLIGTGVAGINRAFRLDEFRNGQSTLVAVEEVRAGVHPLDARGVWALGQIGGSITWAHGVSGDACGPNNQWDRSDDVLGCGKLHDVVGQDFLTEQRMPCVHYVDRNDQSTARSQHPHGVNILFLDGAVRFVNDQIDRGLWHVMHSRETPADAVTARFETSLGPYEPPADLQTPARPAATLTVGERLTNSIGMTLVALPAGEFEMGIPDEGNSAPPPPECPIHKVRISASFWMGTHEVSQSQYRAVMGSNPSFHIESMAAGEFPVENVPWDEAQAFCRRLSELAEEKKAGRQYRLPTEAEWEYACRSGKNEPYQMTSRRDPSSDTGANVGVSPTLPIAKAGSYLANDFGLYDMRGNVWEWCSDWFDRAYYSRSPLSDPQGPSSGYLKVVRGGDWTFVGESCRINYPMMPPWKGSRYVGFRVVCDAARSSLSSDVNVGSRPESGETATGPVP